MTTRVQEQTLASIDSRLAVMNPMCIEHGFAAENKSLRTTAYPECIRPRTTNSHGRLNDTGNAIIQRMTVPKEQQSTLSGV